MVGWLSKFNVFQSYGLLMIVSESSLRVVWSHAIPILILYKRDVSPVLIDWRNVLKIKNG